MVEYIRSTSDYETGTLVSITLYEPWEVTRYQTGSNITDYAYTGQMKERYLLLQYEMVRPQLGRFMRADTIVPPIQGIQGFDRFAYVNNNLCFIEM